MSVRLRCAGVDDGAEESAPWILSAVWRIRVFGSQVISSRSYLFWLPSFFFMNSATSWSHDGARFRLQRSLSDLVLSCSALRIDMGRAGRFVRFRLADLLNFWATEMSYALVIPRTPLKPMRKSAEQPLSALRLAGD